MYSSSQYCDWLPHGGPFNCHNLWEEGSSEQQELCKPSFRCYLWNSIQHDFDTLQIKEAGAERLCNKARKQEKGPTGS